MYLPSSCLFLPGLGLLMQSLEFQDLVILPQEHHFSQAVTKDKEFLDWGKIIIWGVEHQVVSKNKTKCNLIIYMQKENINTNKQLGF